MFTLFKKEEETIDPVKVHNRLIDIRIGRKYARGDNMNGNTYEFLDHTAEEIYEYSMKNSEDLKNVNKTHFIEGYNLQRKELSLILKRSLKLDIAN